jgi:Asp-tRNA(Asn)/Glu-tRNA(Gln) amidotransferase A subunit family amidase
VAADAQEAFAELAGALGGQCVDFDLPESLHAAWDWHRTIMDAEMAANLDLEWERGREQLSAPLRERLSRGRGVSALEYQKAVARIAIANECFEELYASFDAILTPAAPGTAPAGLASTGDASFCTLWSLCGMPAASLPLMQGENGLPLGVQLVGRRGDDARLLRTARWLETKLAQTANDGKG